MNPSIGLQNSLKQQLTLSPQMIQTFEILAMSTLELQQKIRQEIDQNPALEIPRERSLSVERIAEGETMGKIEEAYSDSTPFDPDRYYATTRTSYSFDQEAAERNHQFIEGALAKGKTLQEHLLDQLGCLPLTEEEFSIGHLIISNLNRKGFHTLPVESLAKTGKEKTLIKKMLPVVQSLDPPGIATVDFKESLIIQAKHDNLSPENLEVFSLLVEGHLEQLRLHKTKDIAKALQITEEKVEVLSGYLKTLTPYPGLQFTQDETQYAIPDLVVRKRDGRLELRLNSEAIPTLTLDTEFASMSIDTRDAAYKETTNYIQNAVKSANLLISQISMRSETMKKIGLELLKFQHDFFLHGPRHLKPLTYKVIAEDLNLHETTISRAVQGKYIDTDWGILPIKELFSSALQATQSGEEDVSKRAVMDMILEIIENHTEKKPLSDQKISDMLAQKGIKIARRTVSKYRNALQIDSSYVRTP